MKISIIAFIFIGSFVIFGNAEDERCPKVEAGGFGLCFVECDPDVQSSCPQGKICCSSGPCSKSCVDEINIRKRRQTSNVAKRRQTPGSCPITTLGCAGTIVNKCDSRRPDSCPNGQKCCPGGCGSSCKRVNKKRNSKNT